MSYPPPTFESKGVLIEKLGEDTEQFVLSNVYFKNGKGLLAINEIERLEAELYDVAKDPTIKEKQLAELRPRQPKTEGMTPEDAQQELDDWRELMKQWEMANMALKMQVPIPDMFAIKQYMRPFWRTIHATPAVKGRRFHAFTKDPAEQQGGGLFGLGKKGPPSG